MAYTQANRSLKIDTPLGSDVLLLHSINGQECISRLFRFQLELLSLDPSVKYDDLVGKPVNVTYKVATTERYVHGYVSKLTQSGSDPTFTHYTADLVPWLWFLTLRSNCRIFQNRTTPEIIEKIFGDAGFSDFKIDLQKNYRKRVYCVQYRETDFNFISRLMEEEGIFYFFKHEQNKHTLLIADDSRVHLPCEAQDKARYQTDPDAVTEEDIVFEWEIQNEVRPGKYSLSDFNFEMPSTSLAANISGNGQNGKHEIYDYPGEYSLKAEGDTLVKVRLEEEETPGVVVAAAGNCRAFAAGYKFDLQHHYRDDMNKSYILTAVSHDATESYSRDQPGGEFDYQNTFSCIPADVPFRPARITPKPFVQGPQTAIVVGPSGEEIWVDKYGRVKVQFHWDREGQRDENSSCWVRVSQNWAGQNWGAMFIPRIGQEVIIDFLEGDPDRPIITGRVYNAEQMPPYALPAEQTKSTIKTRSSKGGSPDNFNEIRFEDKKGEEQLFIHAEKNQDIEVENDETHWVGNDRTKTIDHDETSHIKNNRTETVDKDETITIVENRTEKVGKDETITIDGNRTEKVGKDETITIDANRTEQVKKDETVNVDSNRSHTIGKNDTLDVGKTLNITAGDRITITTGSASIDMKSSGDITVSGKKITIKGSGNVIIKGKKILEN